MKHARLEELRTVADLQAAPPPRPLTRRERLERWAELLDASPGRRIRSLEEMEFTPRAQRPAMRADNSPLAVAFEDARLREDGLASDRLGDGMAFFALSERQAHRLLCSCMNGRTIDGPKLASKLRRIGSRPGLSVPLAASAAVLAVGAPALLFLFG